MKELILVGCGGALGAILRYGLGLLPMRTSFPFMTMLINILGALCIGMIIAYAQETKAQPDIILFIKTGFCGGFMTFSTFSLETVQLFETQRYLSGSIYACGSLLFCILAVLLGRWLMLLFLS